MKNEKSVLEKFVLEMGITLSNPNEEPNEEPDEIMEYELEVTDDEDRIE